MTSEAGKYVIGKAVWDEGMRGHFIRMFSTTGPQDIEIMVAKIEAEAVAAERARIRTGVLSAEMFEGCGGMGCTEERNDELATVLAIVGGETS